MAKTKTRARKSTPRARARAPAAIVRAAPAAVPRRRRRPTPRKDNAALKGGIAALVGGAGGALAGGLLVKAGIKPTTAAVGITVAGAVGTFTLEGTARAVSAGVTSSGAGQLALTWLATVRNDMPMVHGGQALPAAQDFARNEPPTLQPPLDIIDIDDAFAQARNQFHEYDDDDDDEEDDILVQMDAA